MHESDITFNRPPFLEKGLAHVCQAYQNLHVSGDGEFARRSQEFLERRLGNCPALLLELQPGDEVIVPAFTFVSTANAFVLRSARLVFVDVRPDTLNLDGARAVFQCGDIAERLRRTEPDHR